MHTITNLDGGTPGASIELARNYVFDPYFERVGTVWSTSNASHVAGSGAIEITVTEASTGNMLTGGSGWANNLVGMPVSAAFLVENTGAVPFKVQPRFYDGVAYQSVPEVNIPVGGARRVVIENKVMVGTYVQVRLWQVASTVGARVKVTEPVLNPGATAAEFFGARTPDVPEDDLFYDWAGTVGNSATIKRRRTWSILNKTQPLGVAGYAAARRSRNEFHDLLDGSIGVSFVPPRPRNGTLVTVYDNRADAHAAVTMYAAGRLFRYAHPDLPELGMDFALDGNLDIEQDPADTNVWYVLVGYQEV